MVAATLDGHERLGPGWLISPQKSLSSEDDGCQSLEGKNPSVF